MCSKLIKKITNIHVDVTAEVLQELDLTLAEEKASLDGHGAVHSPVETDQDLCLILRHIFTVLKFQQVQVKFWICLDKQQEETTMMSNLYGYLH